jgi:hypothetical protein
MNDGLIIVLISSVILVAGVAISQKWKHLRMYGKVAEGVVFKIERRSNDDRSGTPIVRFLTDKQEWITTEIDRVGVSLEEGARVTVVYDPEEPTKVVEYSSLQMTHLPMVLMVAGALGLIAGVLVYAELI